MENNECKRTMDVTIQLPNKDSSAQHYVEIGMFAYRKGDKVIDDIMEPIVKSKEQYNNSSDYDVFVIMWLMYKINNEDYTHSIAFDGLDIWDMKICLVNDEVVFVDRNGDYVLNEEFYTRISNELRKRCKELNWI